MNIGTRWILLSLALQSATSIGAAYRTENFHVEAPTVAIAKQIGQAGEQHRKEQSIAWLGKEMPAWLEPCPIKVTITPTGSAGSTTFTFDRGKVRGQRMTLEGSLDRLLVAVLPHETTHLIFAHHFGKQVIRWVDEGSAVLAEDTAHRARRDDLCREILNTPGRPIPLRRLLPFREYPSDVTALYAEAYGLVKFLVGSADRSVFLAFVAHGMRENDWDAAVKLHYGYRSVEELERAWFKQAKLAETE
jgi:hypothetical protein